MLLYRDGTWLLSVRAGGVAYAPGLLGLIGGHLEPGDADLESTARRELAEETGVDLTGVPLRYLESELFDANGEDQITVTFVAAAPVGIEPRVRQPTELTEVGWWARSSLEHDPRCPPWLVALIDRAQTMVR